jgi:predicted DNA-binding transcriptional regulator AlpA
MSRLRRPTPEPKPGGDEIIEPLLYDMDKACEILGNISKPTIYRLIRRGMLHPVKQGKRTAFTAVELRRYVSEVEAQATQPESSPDQDPQ